MNEVSLVYFMQTLENMYATMNRFCFVFLVFNQLQMIFAVFFDIKDSSVIIPSKSILIEIVV